MAIPNSGEDRYIRAEDILGAWLAHGEQSEGESFASLLAAHPDLAAELRERRES